MKNVIHEPAEVFITRPRDETMRVFYEHTARINMDEFASAYDGIWRCSELYKILGLGEDMDIKRKIKKVIFNDPATIVYWTDGSKTVVKTMPGDEFCPEYGLSMAICKKYFGSNSAYKRYVREWIKE